MPNSRFYFKKFSVNQDKVGMKIGTDGVLLGAWVKGGNPKYILDIGTGSGLLAFMMAQRYPGSIIDAIEIEEMACQQAGENAMNSVFGERINVKCIDFNKFYIDEVKKYDLIISNPPYFQDALQSPSWQKNLAKHQKTLSVEELVKGVSCLLTKEGAFYVVLPHEHKSNLLKIALQNGLYCNGMLNIHSFEGKAIVRTVFKLEKRSEKLIKEELSIYSAGQQYSEKYKQLTADFYLKL